MRLSVSVLCFLLLPVSMWGGSRTLLVADASSQEIQNARANADNLSRMRSTAMIRRFARSGYLVPVPANSKYYYIHAVNPAYRYCRPWTKLFLDRLSEQYYARFKQRLRVTSLVRTTVSQRQLARRNGNAADAFGELRSSHLTGATIDISKRHMSPEARQWIRDVLYSLREQGYLYAIEEFSQPTFHVMVYGNYPEYVAKLTGRKPDTQLRASQDSDSESGSD